MFHRTLSLIALTLSALPSAAQTTYHVDISAVPPGLGTTAAPWTSIQTAVDQAALGADDTILVAPGTYYENVSVPGGSIFRIESSGGALVTELRSGSAGFPTYIWSQSSSIVTMVGFTVAGSSAGGIFAKGVLYLSDSIVRDNVGRGVSAPDTSLIERCTFKNNGVAIKGWNGTDATIHDSIFWGNTLDLLIFGGAYSDFEVRNSLFSWSKSTVSLLGGILSGNLHRDPRWWDPAADDLFLRPRSICIGAGLSGGDLGALPFDASHAPDAPTTFCNSKTNSLACTPTIGFSGAPSVSGGSFDIDCTNVLSIKLGFLYYGHQTKFVPFQGGWKCVRAPIARTPAQSSGGNTAPVDCSGTFTFDFGARLAAGTYPELVAGVPVFAQYWYRDPNDPTGFANGRSDALGFTIQP